MTSGGHVFLDKSNFFSYFYMSLPSDHFCQIILNSDEWFQRRRFLKSTLL